MRVIWERRQSDSRVAIPREPCDWLAGLPLIRTPAAAGWFEPLGLRVDQLGGRGVVRFRVRHDGSLVLRPVDAPAAGRLSTARRTRVQGASATAEPR